MSNLCVEERGRALLVTIDREQRGNSLSRATLSEFAELKARIARGSESELRAIVITGRGRRVFCAGADLKERANMSHEQVREQLRAYRTELGWLAESPIPVVAAINGAALGGGLELALLCDLRVAVSHAILGLPETSLAIIPGAGGTQYLPRLIGEARAKELILLGRPITARTAHNYGLVNHVLPADGDVVAAVLQYIEPILSGAALAQAAALQAVDLAAHTPIQEGLRQELSLYERCLQSQDRVEALRARRQKRAPQFAGK